LELTVPQRKARELDRLIDDLARRNDCVSVVKVQAIKARVLGEKSA
jgi:hypothetical protein